MFTRLRPSRKSDFGAYGAHSYHGSPLRRDWETNDWVDQVPLERFKNNLRTMVESILAPSEPGGKTPRVLLITPPPIDVQMLKEYGPRGGTDRSAEVTVEYAEAVMEIGREFAGPNINALDFHELLSVTAAASAENPSANSPISLREYSTDGLHLGPQVSSSWKFENRKYL